MGKIIGSWLVKVHQHAIVAADASDEDIAAIETIAAPTNDVVKAAVIAGLERELGGEVTVSLIERTDD